MILNNYEKINQQITMSNLTTSNTIFPHRIRGALNNLPLDFKWLSDAFYKSNSRLKIDSVLSILNVSLFPKLFPVLIKSSKLRDGAQPFWVM